jgi:hypothetical protein
MVLKHNYIIHLVVVPLSGAEDQYYCAVYYLLLFQIAKLRKYLKLKKIVDGRVKNQN